MMWAGREGFALAFLIVFLIISSGFVIALTREEKIELRECNAVCSAEQRTEREECGVGYKECRLDCRVEYRKCLNEIFLEKNLCRAECLEKNEMGEFETRRDLGMCYRECSEIYYANRKERCDAKLCNDGCKENRKICFSGALEKQSQCKNTCDLTYLKEEAVVEFDYLYDEETCNDSGGFYQKLCRGHFFRMLCSREKYCICGGDNEYICPADYECVKDFKIDISLDRSRLEGWTNQLGINIGDAGICAKKN